MVQLHFGGGGRYAGLKLIFIEMLQGTVSLVFVKQVWLNCHGDSN